MDKGFENSTSKEWFRPTNFENMKRESARLRQSVTISISSSSTSVRCLSLQQQSSEEIWMAEEKSIVKKTHKIEQEFQYTNTLMVDERTKAGIGFMCNATVSRKEKVESCTREVKVVCHRKGAAPKESEAKSNEQMMQQLGAEVRNLSLNTSNASTTGSNAPAHQFDRKDLIEDLKKDGFGLKPSATNLVQVPKLVSEKEGVEFMKCLSKKEKKKLRRKWKRLDKQMKRQMLLPPLHRRATESGAIDRVAATSRGNQDTRYWSKNCKPRRHKNSDSDESMLSLNNASYSIHVFLHF